jgi:hypothetical protein
VKIHKTVNAGFLFAKQSLKTSNYGDLTLLSAFSFFACPSNAGKTPLLGDVLAFIHVLHNIYEDTTQRRVGLTVITCCHISN